VEVVRTLPVPYLDESRPEPAPAPPRQAVREPPAKILQVVARRAEERRRARREAESGASSGKAGADGAKTTPPAPAESKAAAPTDAKPGVPTDAKATHPADPKAKAADPKSGTAKTEPPEPDTWSDTEIIAALRDCLRRLAPLGADIEIAEPVKQERCGAPAPVVLRRIGWGATRVELQPPATLNCAMVASLGTWIDKTLQPAAQEHLGSPIVRIRNVSGYACRNRIGTAFHADRLSEHALANAIDIAGFVTADGRTVDVLGQWGPTARELRDEQERAWSATQDAKVAVKAAEKEASQAARAARGARGTKQASAKTEEADRTKQAAARKKEEAAQKEAEWRRALARSAELQKLGRGTDEPPRPKRGEAHRKTADARRLTPIPVSNDGAGSSGASSIPPESAFLRRLHRGACGTFGTVLGPDANEAHRNHFHFDLAQRKRSAFCE
jgi:hypothetical protein